MYIIISNESVTRQEGVETSLIWMRTCPVGSLNVNMGPPGMFSVQYIYYSACHALTVGYLCGLLSPSVWEGYVHLDGWSERVPPSVHGPVGRPELARLVCGVHACIGRSMHSRIANCPLQE